MAADAPLGEPDAELARILGAARAAGIALPALGGLAVRLLCPSAARPPLSRGYKDIDLATPARHARRATELLSGLGYRPDEAFNRLHGHQRLYLWDPVNARRIDVFVDRFSMCHELDLRPALREGAATLPAADLLLTKLQVVQINEKDLQDAAALLIDLPLEPKGIDPQRIASVVGDDWGWWRTVTGNLGVLTRYGTSLPEELGGRLQEALERLSGEIERAPRSLRWRMRARLGERVRWYEEPEEIEG